MMKNKHDHLTKIQKVMKTRIFSLLVFMGLSSVTLFAGSSKTEKFKVAGNCDMCKTRIEKAAKSVEGVSAAEWNKETKMIEVTFNSEDAQLQKVHEAIAKAGHDTEIISASDETYASLPACCKYERITKQTASSQ
jgi:copper chaperone CopZ